MRPFRGNSRIDVGSMTSPTLASVVCKTSLPSVTFTPCAREPTISVISRASFWPTSSRRDCFVEASGLATAKQSLRLEVGQKLALEITLMVGSLAQGVKVTDGSEVLQTTDASVAEVIEPTSIRELPLNGRMLIDLVLTVPGAHAGFGAQTR